MKRKLTFTTLFLLLLGSTFNSCQNVVKIEEEEIDCTPYISNPRIEWYSLNDCQLTDGNYSSVYYVLVDKYGECISSASPFTISSKFYQEDGTEIQELSFSSNYYATKDKIELGVCLRFGDASYAKTEIYCTADNGEKSNTLHYTLKRPQGAL